MKVSAKEFALYVKARIKEGCGYIMGATGQNPAKWSKTSWWFTQYKKAKDRAKALWWRVYAPRVYDCNGLAEGFYYDKTGKSINTRARNNYSEWCGTKGTGIIPASKRVPGAAVFHHNGLYIHHVGFLIEPVVAGHPEGDWYVGEARGVHYGCVMTRLYDKGRWNRWGTMDKYFDYSNVVPIEEPPVIAPAPPETPTGEKVYPSTGYAPDISSYQNLGDMATFCAENLVVFARFWVNLLADIKFKVWAVEWAKRKFPFWMYIFFKVRSVAEAEKLADKTIQYFNKYGPVGLWVDLETLYKGVTYEDNYKFVRAYVARCRAGGIDKIGLYTGEYRYKAFYYKLMDIFDCLWIANYGENTGFVNSSLDVKASWHQFTSMRGARVKGVPIPKIPGIFNRCDASRFIGAEGKPLEYFTERKHSGTPYCGLVRASVVANIRTGPGTDYKLIAQVQPGYELELMELPNKYSTWYAVKYRDKPAFIAKSVSKEARW